MKNRLVVFAREPVVGKVKTRLAADVGDRAAAEFYQSMLIDVLQSCNGLTGIEKTVYWAGQESSLAALSERYSCLSRQQSEGDLGQRMCSAFADAFDEGCDNCCIIGSDAPDLPVSYIEDAFLQLSLSNADLVLGEAADGGYYLIGMSEQHDELFQGVKWSSATVLRDTVAKADGLKIHTLPKWFDIDTVADLSAYYARKKAFDIP